MAIDVGMFLDDLDRLFRYVVEGNSVVKYLVGQNTLNDILAALIAFAVTLVALQLVRRTLSRWVESIATERGAALDDLIVRLARVVGGSWALIVALYVAIEFVSVPDFIRRLVHALTFVVLSYYVVKAVQRVVDRTIRGVANRRRSEGEDIDVALVDLASKAQKAVIWVVAAVVILSNLGYDVSTIVATLGVGGIAIAFGMQRVLEDIFASFSIYIDRPFQPEDYIAIGHDEGTVKHIGLRSTRLQALEGEEIVVPNREITGVRINNFHRMAHRRVSFEVGVAYETPTEKLRAVPDMVKGIIGSVRHARADRVHFKRYGDYALYFEVVYFIDESDYALFMDVQQAVNLGVKEAFEREGIQFAYPTHVIHQAQPTKR